MGRRYVAVRLRKPGLPRAHRRWNAPSGAGSCRAEFPAMSPRRRPDVTIGEYGGKFVVQPSPGAGEKTYITISALTHLYLCLGM